MIHLPIPIQFCPTP